MSQQEIRNKKLAFELLGESLSLIQDETVLAATVDVLARRTPDHFWYFPASTSGKYHPPKAREKYGLVWHVNYAVQWGLRLLSRIKNEHFPETFDILQDRVLQALILHDLWKNGSYELSGYQQQQVKEGGWPKRPAGITGTHGGELARALNKIEVPTGSLSPVVAVAIGAHMGPWTDDKYTFWSDRLGLDKPERDIVETVQLADYCAAQYFGDSE